MWLTDLSNLAIDYTTNIEVVLNSNSNSLSNASYKTSESSRKEQTLKNSAEHLKQFILQSRGSFVFQDMLDCITRSNHR